MLDGGMIVQRCDLVGLGATWVPGAWFVTPCYPYLGSSAGLSEMIGKERKGAEAFQRGFQSHAGTHVAGSDPGTVLAGTRPA